MCGGGLGVVWKTKLGPSGWDSIHVSIRYLWYGTEMGWEEKEPPPL